MQHPQNLSKNLPECLEQQLCLGSHAETQHVQTHMSVAPSESYCALGMVALNSVMQPVSADAKMYTTVIFNTQTAIKMENQQLSVVGSSC